ncbi:unnamed protein product [Closterium sp. NIES-54]
MVVPVVVLPRWPRRHPSAAPPPFGGPVATPQRPLRPSVAPSPPLSGLVATPQRPPLPLGGLSRGPLRPSGAAGLAGVGAVGAEGAAGTGAATGGPGAVPVGTGDPARPRPYFVPSPEQVVGLPPSPGPAPPLECPQPVPSQSQLQPVSLLPAPSPYAGPTGGLAERREPASRPASPARTARPSSRTPRLRPPALPGTHQMTLRPSTAPLRVSLPSPPASSLPVLADPASDSLRAASPTVARLVSTFVTDPSFESTTASALVAELVDFAARCRLDYVASLVTESASVCPPSVGGECALSTDVLEDRPQEFQCFAAALPHLVSTLIAPEGDPDAPDIPTPRSYAEAIEGPYSSQWESAMDVEMASWKSTSTYVDEVPPPGTNIVIGMWIFRVKRPPGSPPVFKARYVARGFSQRQGVDYFQTFSPTPKMTTLRVLLHVAAQRDYELHSLDFSTAFLQGSLHEEIWLRRPPGFTGSFPPEHMAAAKRVLRYLCSTSGLGLVLGGRRPVVLTGHADASWADDQATQRSSQGYTFSLGSGSVSWRSTRSSSVLGSSCEAEIYAGAMAAQELRWLTYLLIDLGEPPRSPPVLYVENKAMLALCREHRLEHKTKHIALRYFLARELQQRGQLCLAYVASEANTADIFTKAVPPGFPTSPPSDESLELSGPYPELVVCLMYLMTCTRPDLAYPLSLLARYVAPGRHRKVHWDAAKRVLRYLCNTSGMGLVLARQGPVVLTGHLDASWVDDSATQWSSQGYTFNLGSGSVSWWSTRSSSVLISSCEAEIYAGAMAAQELRWLTYLLTDLGEQPRSPLVLVRDPFAELGGLAARRIALLVSQPLGLCADLEEAALDIPDLQVFWAHASLMKEWRGKSVRLRRTCELFLESSFPSSIIVSSCWDVEQELLLFNRCLLLNRKWPAGKQKVAKHLRRAVMKDFITIDENGVRALKDKAALEREFGGTHGAKLAKRIFYAAPDDWEQLLLVRVTARTVLAVSKFVLRAGTSHGVWRIESVEEETLVCRAVSCFREILGGAGERLRTFLPHEVVPAMVKEGFKCYGGKPKQQSSWEEELGHPIGWQRMIGVRDSTVLPNRARDVMLRVHSKNLQVGERLHFMGAGVACPHSGEKETLDHGLFSCPRIQLVVKALLQARRMLNPRQKVESLGDLLFQREGTVSGFPEATITSIALHRI